MTIAYIAQQSSTGALAQAQILEQHIADVTFVRSTSIGADDVDAPYIEGEGMIYPTRGLAEAVRALDPDVVLVHIINQEVVQELPEIQATHPVLMRAGVNIHEAVLAGAQGLAAGLPTTIQALQSFDHLIAPSNQAANDLNALGADEERITVLPSAISLEHAREPNFNAPVAAGCLSTRLSPLKNQHTLIVAMGALREIEPSVTVPLYLPGANAGYGQVLQQTANVMGLGNRVQTDLFYEDPEADFFPNIGVHLMPSFSERLPLAVLEAARAGVPNIVAETGWAEEFDSMVTAPPDDPWSWAWELNELLANDARRVRIAREQQRELAEKFDVEEVARRYERLFEDVTARASPFKVPLAAFDRGPA